MKISYINMTLKSYKHIVGFTNNAVPNKLIKAHLNELEKASNMELYGILDLVLFINFNEAL